MGHKSQLLAWLCAVLLMFFPFTTALAALLGALPLKAPTFLRGEVSQPEQQAALPVDPGPDEWPEQPVVFSVPGADGEEFRIRKSDVKVMHECLDPAKWTFTSSEVRQKFATVIAHHLARINVETSREIITKIFGIKKKHKYMRRDLGGCGDPDHWEANVMAGQPPCISTMQATRTELEQACGKDNEGKNALEELERAKGPEAVGTLYRAMAEGVESQRELSTLFLEAGIEKEFVASNLARELWFGHFDKERMVRIPALQKVLIDPYDNWLLLLMDVVSVSSEIERSVVWENLQASHTPVNLSGEVKGSIKQLLEQYYEQTQEADKQRGRFGAEIHLARKGSRWTCRFAFRPDGYNSQNITRFVLTDVVTPALPPTAALDQPEAQRAAEQELVALAQLRESLQMFTAVELEETSADQPAHWWDGAHGSIWGDRGGCSRGFEDGARIKAIAEAAAGDEKEAFPGGFWKVLIRYDEDGSGRKQAQIALITQDADKNELVVFVKNSQYYEGGLCKGLGINWGDAGARDYWHPVVVFKTSKP